MADEIKNRLKIISGDKSLVEKLLSDVSGVSEYEGQKYDLVIDFNKIKPIPPELTASENWRKAHVEYWGTKTFYVHDQERIDDNTIGFTTAWNGVPGLMLELSAMYPDVSLKYTHSCVSCDDGLLCGEYEFRGGEVITENTPTKGTAEFEAIEAMFTGDTD